VGLFWDKFNVTQLIATSPATMTTPAAPLQWYVTLIGRHCSSVANRHHSRLAMLYKTYNCLVDTDFTSQLTLTQSSTRGHASRFLQPQCSCAAYSNSFLPRTIRDWNALATDPLLFQTVDAFKNYLVTDPSCHHFRF